MSLKNWPKLRKAKDHPLPHGWNLQMMRQTGNISQMVRQSRKVRSPSPILGPNDLRSSIGINMRQHKKFSFMPSALFAKWPTWKGG